MSREYYKVVRVTNGKLTSCSVPENSQFCLNYYTNRWTEAKLGGILVFNSLFAAKDFFGTYCHEDTHKIYSCECQIPVKVPIYGIPAHKITKFFEHEISELWQNPKNIPNFVLEQVSGCFPCGTKAFKRIRLKELVEW